MGEEKRIRGKKQPLTAAGVQGLREEYTRTIEPARVLAAETLKLERTLSELVNQAYGLTRAETELMWKAAQSPLRLPPLRQRRRGGYVIYDVSVGVSVSMWSHPIHGVCG